MTLEFSLVNKTLCVVAKRNSGKSVLIKYLVTCEKGQFSKIYVICPTEKINRFYNSIVPDQCIFDSWSEEWANALIKKMTEINANKTASERKNVLIILDDVFSDTNFHQSQALKVLHVRGRHLNISIINTIQYLNLLPPICRTNCDYLISGQMNRQSVQLLAEEYISGDIEKNDFIKMYNRVTKDYGFLLINNNSIKNNEDLNQIYGIMKTPPEFVK